MHAHSRFTGTNNQESGVDELDTVEADAAGNFYIVDGHHLVIANGLPPADLREIAKLDLGAGASIAGLVLDPEKQRLAVVKSSLGLFAPVSTTILPPWHTDPITEVVFIDVANPAAPVIDRRLKIEGFKLAVRRIGSRVHVVSHTTPVIPLPIVTDARILDLRQRLAAAVEDSDAARRVAGEIRALVGVLVSTTDVEGYLPDIVAQIGSQPAVDVTPPNCANVAIPDVAMPLALTTITSVNSDGTNVDSLTVANNSWDVYASDKHLYLSQTSGGWWFAERQRQQTAIYKVEIGSEAPVYRALGMVDGWMSSSFQLSEHQGHLRVVTNRWERDPRDDVWLQDNNLYVLADDSAGGLQVVGSVKGFGKGERIFSARMLGNRGFVVTFRQIDPLFTFDLSIPQDPRLVGEVEIPGVSTYLHPLDEAHLLTIGFDGDQNRLNGNFQLQIFDVQNLSDPRLVHKYVPKLDARGFAWTQATHDHLAFNYFPAAGTLTVPVQYTAFDLADHFSGFFAFGVSAATGFTELGRLDHSDLARREHCAPPGVATPAVCSSGVYLEAASPRRSVSASYNGATYIYTLSNVGMKVSEAKTFGSAIAVLPLPGGNAYPVPLWWRL